MIHTCTHIITDFQEQHDIEPADLWREVNQHEFVELLCGDFDSAKNITNEAFWSVSKVVAS